MRACVSPSTNARAELEQAKPTWRQSRWSKRSSRASGSGSAAARISSSTYGWQRTAPCPKMIMLRVRMFAPSTVMLIGEACQPRPR
jgi:hypothetical protein